MIDELKQQWKELMSGSVSFDANILGRELDDVIAQVDRDISRRNRREILAAAALIPVFALIGAVTPQALARAGAFMVIPACLLIIYMLRTTKSNRPTDPALPVVQYLTAYRDYLLREKRLLDSAPLWYVAPIMLSIAVYFAGLNRYFLLPPVLLIGAVIWYLNRKAAKAYFGPVLEKVSGELQELTSE